MIFNCETKTYSIVTILLPLILLYACNAGTRKRASTEGSGGSQPKKPTHTPPQQYFFSVSHNWEMKLRWFGPSCVTHNGHILIIGKQPDQQTWRVFVYDLEGQWINFWVPRLPFVPTGIEEVKIAGKWRIAISWGTTPEIDLYDPNTGALVATAKCSFGPGRMNGKSSIGLVVRNCGPYSDDKKGLLVLDTSTEKLKIIKHAQLPVVKNIPYFTVLDLVENDTTKHVFITSSHVSQEVTCVTVGAEFPRWKQNKGEPFYTEQSPYLLCASKQGHIFTLQAKEKEINVFNCRNKSIGLISLPYMHTIHDAHVMDNGNSHRLVILHKEKTFHSDVMRVTVVTPT